MPLLIGLISGLGLLLTPLAAQSTQEEYCAANPQAPACKDAHPLLNWRFAHPHADLLAGMKLSSLRRSATLRELLAEVSGPLQLSAGQLDKALASTEDMDEAWVSVRSGDFLILVQGRLDKPAAFLNLPKGLTSRRISNTAVLMGREASVTEALRRLSAPAGAAGRPMKEWGAESDVWLTATRVFLSQHAPAMPAYVDLNGFSLGISLRDGLKLDMVVNSATRAAAQRMLADMQRSGRSEPSVHQTIKLDGTAVRLTATIEKSELIANVKKALAGPVGKRLAGLAAAQMPTGTAPAPVPGKVTIYGMEGGTKEIIQPPQ